MTCPGYIGKLVDVTAYRYAFAPVEDPAYIYAVQTSSLDREVVAKFRFPELSYVVSRTPVLGGSSYSVTHFAISPHKTGGSASNFTGDGVNDGDIGWVVSRSLWWTPAGAGPTTRLWRVPVDHAIDFVGDPSDVSYMLVLVQQEVSPYGWWLHRLRWPLDDSDAAAIGAVGSDVTEHPIADLLDSGNWVATEYGPASWHLKQAMTPTPDGAVWFSDAEVSTTTKNLYRWTRPGGFEMIRARDPDYPHRGIARAQTVFVPRPNSHVWTVEEESPLSAVNDGIDAAPNGVIVPEPCMDESTHPVYGVQGNVRVSAVAWTPSARLIALNYFNGVLGEVWALRTRPDAGWKINSL